MERIENQKVYAAPGRIMGVIKKTLANMKNYHYL
jgi:hypothetical protein